MLLRKSIRNSSKQLLRFYTTPNHEQQNRKETKVPLSKQLVNFSDLFLRDENAKRIAEDIRKKSPFFKNAETVFSMLRIMNLIVIAAFAVYLIWFYYHMAQTKSQTSTNSAD